MKISLLIAHLKNLQEEHGDLPIYGKLYNQKSIRDIANMWPDNFNVVYKKRRSILKGRGNHEKNLKMWLPADGEDLLDEKVLLIHT